MTSFNLCSIFQEILREKIMQKSQTYQQLQTAFITHQHVGLFGYDWSVSYVGLEKAGGQPCEYVTLNLVTPNIQPLYEIGQTFFLGNQRWQICGVTSDLEHIELTDGEDLYVLKASIPENYQITFRDYVDWSRVPTHQSDSMFYSQFH